MIILKQKIVLCANKAAQYAYDVVGDYEGRHKLITYNGRAGNQDDIFISVMKKDLRGVGGVKVWSWTNNGHSKCLVYDKNSQSLYCFMKAKRFERIIGGKRDIPKYFVALCAITAKRPRQIPLFRNGCKCFDNDLAQQILNGSECLACSDIKQFVVVTLDYSDEATAGVEAAYLMSSDATVSDTYNLLDLCAKDKEECEVASARKKRPAAGFVENSVKCELIVNKMDKTGEKG